MTNTNEYHTPDSRYSPTRTIENYNSPPPPAVASEFTRVSGTNTLATVLPLSTGIVPRPKDAGMQFDELMATPFPVSRCILSGFMLESHVSVFGGAFAQGKTFLWLELTIHLAIGRNVLGMTVTRPYRCLFVDTENGGAEIQSRLKRYISSLKLSFEELQLLNQNWRYVDIQSEGPLHLLDLAKQSGFDSLFMYLTQVYDAEVVVLDCFGKIFSGKEGDENEIKTFCTRCQMLVRGNSRLQTGGLVFLHHFTKVSEMTPGLDLKENPTEYLSRMRGSGRLMDLVQGRYGMCEMKSNDDTYTVVNGISRSVNVSAMLLQRDETGFFSLHCNELLVEQQVFGRAQRLLALFRAMKLAFPVGVNFLFSDVSALPGGWASQQVTDCLKRAVGAKMVEPAPRGYRFPKRVEKIE